MPYLAFLLLVAAPAYAEQAHTGVAGSRTMPELSDIALFAVAAFGVWFVRRSLRARFRAGAKD